MSSKQGSSQSKSSSSSQRSNITTRIEKSGGPGPYRYLQGRSKHSGSMAEYMKYISVFG